MRLDLIPWDTRSVTDLDARDCGAPELELWMRTPPAEPELVAALTAYALVAFYAQEAMVRFATLRSRDLDDHGRAHPAAGAHRGDAQAATAAP